MGLSSDLNTLTQRSGTNVNTLATQAERASFSRNIRADVANLINQLNVVYKPLVQVLTDGTSGTTDALSLGLGGDTMYSNLTATAASASAYWDSTNVRKRTVKETFDVILGELASLQNAINVTVTASTYDDTAIWSATNTNTQNIQQLVKDTHGPDYVLGGSGTPILTYSLSQIIDAIGPMFSGFVPTGNTYTSTYPTLSLTMLLSNVTIDTTLAQSVITNLPTDLADIRTFIGMDTSTPDYTAHGAAIWVTDGDSLEKAIADLDVALQTHGARHIRGAADAINGDLIDIAYNPANYTRTTGGPVTDVEHLTAHLQGIDLALAGGGGGGETLQATYDLGGAGSAGDIQLTNAKGAVTVYNDTTTPLARIFEVWNSTGVVGFTVGDTSVALSNGHFLEMAVRATDPTANAAKGQVYIKDDSGDEELAYQNDSTTAFYMTRDGRVKELEMGSEYVNAQNIISYNEGTGGHPELRYPQGTTAAGGVISARMFKFSEAEYGYFNLAVPKDEQGNYATRFDLDLYTVALVDGSGGSTNDWAFDVFGLDNGGVAGFNDGELLVDNSWVKLATVGTTGRGAGDLKKLYTLSFGTHTIATAGPLMAFQIVRPVGASNTWTEDVGVVGARVTWYR